MKRLNLRMMLLSFLIVAVSGYSESIMLKHEILGTTSRLNMGYTINPEKDEDNSLSKENRTGNGQLTRHMTDTKLLEKRLKENCRNRQTKECEKLLEDLVYAHSGTKKKSHFFRNALEKYNLRICLDGFHVVHFDPKTQLCCDGVYLKHTGNEECCQGEIIDNTEQLCCNENIQNRTDSIGCCGTYTYDITSQTCCHGNLYSQSQGTSCCGSDVYNKETEICCFDRHKFNRSEGDACCGASVYNSSTHTCCHGTIQRAFGKKNRYGKCCKDKSYHLECYKCDNNTILPRFNETTRICCDGRIRDKKYGNDTVCCGRQVMHPTKHLCDNGKKINTPTVTLADNGEQTSVRRQHILSVGNSDSDNHITVNTENLHKKSFPFFVIGICGGVFLIIPAFALVCRCWRTKRRLRRRNLLERKKLNIHTNNDSAITDEQPFLNNWLSVNNTYTNINYDDLREVSSAENKNISLVNEHLLSNISKNGYTNVPTENELMFYSKDSFTQTCPEKETNRRTIFGKPFEHNFILGESNATVEMPNSDVKMTLPISVLKCSKIEVNCTSFTSIVPLRKKLGLTDDRAIASPIVEYALTGHAHLTDYAVVLLPFIGDTESLEVRKFESDEGLNTVVKSIKVPKQTKVNEDLDVFYILKDSHVYVYTKSFSGFYCTTMRHRSLRLRCFLFGSYKRFVDPLRHEVRVMVYIADELMKFADYKERMLTNENAEGRVLKKEMLLKVPHGLAENDIVQFAITPTESHCNQWMHKLYPEQLYPIYDEIQRVELYHIAEKCKECEHCHLPEHDVPYSVEWYMTNVQNVIPSYTFQCIVDIDVIKGDTNTSKTSNRIVIDELQLRHEDRYEVEDNFNTRNIQGVKEYLASCVTPVEREDVLTSLASKYNSPGRTVEEVFFKLQEKLTPNYVLEAVTVVLKEKQMFKHLDCLQAWGYIPRNFISTNTQPVYVDTTEGHFHRSPHSANINNDHQITEENLTEAVQAEESQIHPKPIPKNIDGMVRQELSQTADSFDDIACTIKGETELAEVRGELSTRATNCNSKDETSDAPIQEHASLDETNLKA